MTTFDVEVMREIVNDVFTPHIVRRHGPLGADRLQALLAALRRVYRFRSAERFGSGLTVIANLAGNAIALEGQIGESVQAIEVAGVLADGGTLQVLPNGACWLGSLRPPTTLSSNCPRRRLSTAGGVVLRPSRWRTASRPS